MGWAGAGVPELLSKAVYQDWQNMTCVSNLPAI